MAVSWRLCTGLLPILFIGCALQEGVNAIGVNWGTISINPLPPQIVVNMLQDNKITKVKLFDADNEVLRALAGTNIEVMVAAPNDLLDSLANDPNAATNWVKQNVTQFLYSGGVNIKYVGVGNEPFLAAYNGIYQSTLFPALQNMENALAQAGYASRVKATVPFNADVLSGASFPSQVTFRSDIASLMDQIVQFLNEWEAPFCINLYPFITLYQNPGFPLDFAFFDGSTSPIHDGANTYENVFDASYDGLVSALASAGYSNMSIIVGEIGWPTDGTPSANIQYAQRFNQELVNHLLNGQGTPLRPNMQIQGYLFGLLDEDAKSILPGPFERHWGIFNYDGTAKYTLDISGGANGPNANLVNAQNVPYLRQQWCVVNPNIDLSQLAANVDYACSHADCTDLLDGSSCNTLSLQGNASYAFNNYYQYNNQDPTACNFQGLAEVTNTDPSTGTCHFIIGLKPTAATSRSGASTSIEALRILAISMAATVVTLFFFS